MINAQLTGNDGRQQSLLIEPAFSALARLKGLLGRRDLAPATALWISPCNSVHCFFMRFAIDVLYLDRKQRVIAIRQQLKPWRMSLHGSAHSVLELAAGQCQHLNIQIGDTLQCER